MQLKQSLAKLWSYVASWFGPVLKDLSQLHRSSWVIIFVAGILGFTSFSIELDLMPFFKYRLGLSNKTAGELFGIRGVTSMLVSVPCSMLVDRIGLKSSVMIGAVVSAILSVMLSLSDDKFLIETILNFGLPATAVLIGTPIGISADRIRSPVVKFCCFQLIYWSDNVGDVIAALVNPYMVSFAGFGQFEFLFLATGTGLLVVAIIILFAYHEPPIIVEYIVAGDSNNPVVAYELSELPPSSDDPVEILAEPDPLKVLPTPVEKTTFRSILEVLLARSLWRCIALSFVFMWSRTLFRHMTSIVPIYMQNLYGLDVNYSAAIGLNPATLVIALPVFIVIGRDVQNVSSRLFFGTLLSALAPLPIIFARGGSSLLPVYLTIEIQTIGEMIYSPLLEMLSVSLAPNEHKALYMVLSGLPRVLGTLFSGFEAGYLLENFCPDPVSVNYNHWGMYSCENMWIVISLGALITPFLWILMHSFILSKEQGMICSGRYSELEESKS